VIKEKSGKLANKKTIPFVVAGTPPDQKQKLDAYIQAGVSEEIRKHCVFFLFARRVS